MSLDLSEHCFADQCESCTWGGCQCSCHEDQSWDLLNGWEDES